MVKDSPKLKLPDRAIGLSELSKLVSEACKIANTKYLEALLSRPDAIFLDEPYVQVLKYVTTLERDEHQQKFFNKLMSKNFSVHSIRPLLEDNITVDEVVTICKLAMDLLCRCCADRNEEFLNALDLCNLLFDCHFQKFVWHKDYCNLIGEMNSTLKDMIEVCCQFTTIESASELRTNMPGLFTPPKSDYFMEKITMECVQL